MSLANTIAEANIETDCILAAVLVRASVIVSDGHALAASGGECPGILAVRGSHMSLYQYLQTSSIIFDWQ